MNASLAMRRAYTIERSAHGARCHACLKRILPPPPACSLSTLCTAATVIAFLGRSTTRTCSCSLSIPAPVLYSRPPVAPRQSRLNENEMAVNPSTTQPTLFMPIASPPTPAPSPGPSSPRISAIASISRHEFSSLLPTQRRQFLCAILNDCTPDELSFVSTTIASLLKRDFLRDLPPELAIYILSFLDEPLTLLRAGRVSRYWNGLVADDWIWKHLFYIHGFVGDPRAPNIAAASMTRSLSDDLENTSYPATPPPVERSYRALFRDAFVTCRSFVLTTKRRILN